MERSLISAKQSGKNVKVIVVDSKPFFEGRQLVTVLSQFGIECTYTMLEGMPFVMKNVTKVIVGAAAMTSNGSLMSRSGTAIVAAIAKSYLKPFYVCCETYKFSEDSIVDSLSKNKLEPWKAKPEAEDSKKERRINLRYDLTPTQNIDIVFTDIQRIPASSVPVIIREFHKFDAISRIRLPS